MRGARRGRGVGWAGLLVVEPVGEVMLVCERGCAARRSGRASRRSGRLCRYGAHPGLFPFEVHLAIQVVRYLVFTSEFPRSEESWKRLGFF